MKPRLVEPGVWVAALLLLGAAVWSYARPAVPVAAVSRIASAQGRSSWIAPAESARVWAGAAAAGNPFRFDHRPASVRYGTAPAPDSVPAVQRPTLTLLGTIGGPPWQAIVAGFPGRAGSVVLRSGQDIDGFRVQSITRDGARITGMDTAWSLTVRRAWQ